MRAIRPLLAAQLVGNALLLWLGYYWLGVGESRAATLAWSIVVAFVLLCGVAWLHGSAFVYFREGPPAFRATLRRVLPLVLVGIVVLVLYFLLAAWANYSSAPAAHLASWLTLKLRKPVKPASILRVFNLALWLVEWMVVPVFALPLIADIASFGWRGLRAFGRLAVNWRYWIVAPLLLVCSIWLPLRIVGWVPSVGAFSMQVASLVARLVIGYLLFISAWLLLASLTSRGKPVFSQPKTAVNP